MPFLAATGNAHGYRGFVRVINRTGEAGEVLVDAIDDAGEVHGPVTLSLGAEEAVHVSAADLERGNEAKGLSGGVGEGAGNWRLRLRSSLELEVLGYNRTGDGLVTPMHDVVPRTVVRRAGGEEEADEEVMGHRVAFFNPASDAVRVSLLRIVNPGDSQAG